jgi:hypothetical protein
MLLELDNNFDLPVLGLASLINLVLLDKIEPNYLTFTMNSF